MDLTAMTHEAAIYIVDDEAEVRDALTLLMSTADHKAQAFATAEAFQKGVDLTNPACVLLDVRLPGMNGLDLLEQLKRERKRAAVIVITGHGDVPMAVRAMKLGAFHFVQKPFDPEELLESVDEALRYVQEIKGEQATHGDVATNYNSLTPREQQVMKLLVDGMPSKRIATQLGISVRTAEHHRAAVMRKMNARTLSHLVRMAFAVAAIEQKPI